ncbi:MAG: DUF4352 domain-containing protein [Thermomicrobiales bacterium]|nr:DUF4352 domain-containing protein [Thermomicrobiales bacterium]
MRRVVSVAMSLLLMLSFVAGLHAPRLMAQDTDGAGRAVAMTDAAGQPMIEMTVDSFTPDFQGYDNSYAPDRGFAFAHITVTVTNIGSAPFSPNTYSFQLIDTDGFVSDSAYVLIDESQALPMLSSEPIEPGETVTGSVTFQVLAGTEAAAIGYSVTWDRLTLLAAADTMPAAGDTVEVLDNNARPLVNVTVDDWLDPLPDVDPSSQPNRGYHFAGAVLTIENVGGNTWPVDPYSFKMIDTDGYRNSGTSAWRSDPEIPDLGYDDLAAGDSVTGLLAFQAFNTAQPAFIVFETGDQLTFVASFPDAPTAPSLADIPTVDQIDLPVSTGGGDATEEDVEMSEDCLVIQAYIDEVSALMDESGVAEFEIDDATDLTADELIELQDGFEALQDGLADLDVPEAAQDFHDGFGHVVDFMITSFDDLIDTAEAGEDLTPLVDELLEEEDEFSGYFDGLMALYDQCPDLEF